MKKLSLSALLLAAVSGASLPAQEGAAVSPPPPASPPAAAEPAPVDGLVYVATLPSTAQLMSDAESEGMTITRMDQAADRIVVTYRYSSGRTRTFAYTTVQPAAPDAEVTAMPPVPTTAVIAPPPNYTVIYSEPAPVYYYPRYVRPYDPLRPSLSIGLGFGYGRYDYRRPSPYSYRHRPFPGHSHGHGRPR